MVEYIVAIGVTRVRFPGDALFVILSKEKRHGSTNLLGIFRFQARLAQSVERQALNLMVVGSSPTVGAVLTRVSGISSQTVVKGRSRSQEVISASVV